MSDADFKTYLSLTTKKLAEKGYVEEDGTYKKGFNGMHLRLDAEHALIDFQISLMPEAMKLAFAEYRIHPNINDGLLKMIMGEK